MGAGGKARRQRRVRLQSHVGRAARVKPEVGCNACEDAIEIGGVDIAACDIGAVLWAQFALDADRVADIGTDVGPPVPIERRRRFHQNGLQDVVPIAPARGSGTCSQRRMKPRKTQLAAIVERREGAFNRRRRADDPGGVGQLASKGGGRREVDFIQLLEIA